MLQSSSQKQQEGEHVHKSICTLSPKINLLTFSDIKLHYAIASTPQQPILKR
jgi:hypothetical protein